MDNKGHFDKDYEGRSTFEAVALWRLEALDKRFDKVDLQLQGQETRSQILREKYEERFDKLETEQARVRTWGTIGVLVMGILPGFILKMWK